MKRVSSIISSLHLDFWKQQYLNIVMYKHPVTSICVLLVRIKKNYKMYIILYYIILL